MLATPLEIREIDRPNPPAVAARFVRVLSTIIEYPHALRVLAIAITVALHLLVLWLGFLKASTSENPQQQLRYINLQPLIENQPERYTAPLIEEPRILEEKMNPDSMSVLTMIDLPSTVQTLEPLTQQELQDITDKFRRPAENTPAIAGNVFHPGLRERLSVEANKPKLARVEDAGPKTYIDPSGATIVVLDNGSCLMSPRTTKIGAPQNWYMTSCGGKSESEEMMERVQQSLNGKLTFDE